MIALWIVAGLALGVLAGRRSSATGSRRKAYPVRLSAASAVTHPLGEVIEAMRAMALRVEPRLDGFAVIDQLDKDGATLEVRVTDPKTVSVSSITCSDTMSIDLPFQIALALVPLYGPVSVTVETGLYEIDGTRDRHQLVRELSRRQTERWNELLAARGR